MNYQRTCHVTLVRYSRDLQSELCCQNKYPQHTRTGYTRLEEIAFCVLILQKEQRGPVSTDVLSLTPEVARSKLTEHLTQRQYLIEHHFAGGSRIDEQHRS